MTSFAVVILAAGMGERMRGTLPKVLYPIASEPMLERIVKTAKSLSPKEIIIVCGHQKEKLKAALQHRQDLIWVFQEQQRGTAHAVLQALPHIGTVEKVLIINGDVPLLSDNTLKKLLHESAESPCVLLTVSVKDPHGLGRILRNEKGEVIGIREEKDASASERKIKEICAGVFLVNKEALSRWLPKIKPHNAQNEYYLTDIIKLCTEEQLPIATVNPTEEYEALGINDKAQLAQVERIFQKHKAHELMKQGLMLLDPARFDLRGELTFGQDVSIDINVVLEGNVKLGNQISIGPHVIIKNSEIHDGVTILSHCVIEGAIIGAGAVVGPFSRIRPKTELGINSKIGNFVEIKQSKVGAKSKINHLSYIGDAFIGQEVNVGAGTITCNYDGKDKHETWIGDHVSIGSDTQLIAPVKIGNGAVIGAGTTVVRDVLQNELIHNRISHRSIIKTDLEKN